MSAHNTSFTDVVSQVQGINFLSDTCYNRVVGQCIFLSVLYNGQSTFCSMLICFDESIAFFVYVIVFIIKLVEFVSQFDGEIVAYDWVVPQIFLIVSFFGSGRFSDSQLPLSIFGDEIPLKQSWNTPLHW